MNPAVQSHVDAVQQVAVITTRFDHSVDVVWSLFSDPGKLARWWGPPGVPMTVDRHALHPGGTVELTVTAEHEVVRARWSIHAVDPPNSLAFTFASDGLEPAEIDVALEAISASTTAMVLTVRFSSPEDVQHALAIGFVEGLARSCTSALDVVADT